MNRILLILFCLPLLFAQQVFHPPKTPAAVQLPMCPSTTLLDGQTTVWLAAQNCWNPTYPLVGSAGPMGPAGPTGPPGTGGGGNADPAGFATVSFSSTPTFAIDANTGKTMQLTLTGNVSSSTLDTSGITHSGFPISTIRICQDSGGSHSFVWPTNVQNHGAVDPTANACSTQTFVWDGTNLQALGNVIVTGLSGDAVIFPGSTSGSTKLQASATASGVLTMPARTATVATTTGSTPTNDCAKFDSLGNLVDSGGACGGGGGGGVSVLASNWNSVAGPQVAGSATAYLPVFGQMFSQNLNGANVALTVHHNGTANLLCITTADAQPGDGALVITLMTGPSTASAVTKTVAAGAAAAEYCSSVTDTFASGGALSARAVNASASPSAHIYTVSLEIQ